MALTVYAEGMGLFHEGSGGKGIAPLDFCLSPPPPPAGPLPIPYVNLLQASDLAKGSKTVKIDGQPTALEDASYISTSTGDEMGTQGGSVMTAKTKGKGYFALWSSTVLIEGKGVCRHGDLMGQNCASMMPPGCIDASAVVDFNIGVDRGANEKCKDPYDDTKRVETTQNQQDAVQNENCWQCGKSPKDVVDKAREEIIDREKITAERIKKGKKPRKKESILALQQIVDKHDRVIERNGVKVKHRNPMDADHQPPLKVAWEMGGCHEPAKFKEWAELETTTKPHCYFCSRGQATVVRKMKPADIKQLRTECQKIKGKS